MGKYLILYKSKYGATKKYVDMLKAELDCDAYEIDAYRSQTLASYDRIVFAGGIYASGIAGLNALRRKCGGLDPRKLVIFCVGASPFDEKALAEIRARNLKADLKDIPLFYGRGAWDADKMSWKDRALCGMLQKAVAKMDPNAREPWMEALLSAKGHSCDWTDRSYLTPLLEHLNAGTQI